MCVSLNKLHKLCLCSQFVCLRAFISTTAILSGVWDIGFTTQAPGCGDCAVLSLPLVDAGSLLSRYLLEQARRDYTEQIAVQSLQPGWVN